MKIDVKGIKLYDPRSVSYVESNNPALILRDLLKRTGRLDLVTDDTISDMADVFDEQCVGLNGIVEAPWKS